MLSTTQKVDKKTRIRLLYLTRCHQQLHNVMIRLKTSQICYHIIDRRLPCRQGKAINAWTRPKSHPKRCSVVPERTQYRLKRTIALLTTNEDHTYEVSIYDCTVPWTPAVKWLCVGGDENPLMRTLNWQRLLLSASQISKNFCFGVRICFKSWYSQMLRKMWSRLKTSATWGRPINC